MCTAHGEAHVASHKNPKVFHFTTSTPQKSLHSSPRDHMEAHGGGPAQGTHNAQSPGASAAQGPIALVPISMRPDSALFGKMMQLAHELKAAQRSAQVRC